MDSSSATVLPDPLAVLRTTRLPYDLVRDLTGLRDTGGPLRLDALEALLAHERGADALAGLFLVGARSLLQELATANREPLIDGTTALQRAVLRLAEASRGGRRLDETAVMHSLLFDR